MDRISKCIRVDAGFFEISKQVFLVQFGCLVLGFIELSLNIRISETMSMRNNHRALQTQRHAHVRVRVHEYAYIHHGIVDGNIKHEAENKAEWLANK